MITEEKFNQIMDDIEKGYHNIRYITQIPEKERAEKVLLEKFNNGTITDAGRRALLGYQGDKIKSGNYTIDDIPEELRDIVKSALKIS